jgi:uncharacterized protein (TIGR00251 family)
MIQSTPDGIIISIRVIPRARRSGLVGTRGDALLVRLRAPPVEGAANIELVDVMATALRVPKRLVSIVAGHYSRQKRVRVSGIDAATAASRCPTGCGCSPRPTRTVYAIRQGRSFDDAATILAPDFEGVLLRDGWAPYRQFTAALHQTCVTHLLRRTRTLRLDHPRSPWPTAVQQVLVDGLALRDRRDAQDISEHGLAVARGRLLARLAGLIDAAPALPAAQRFAAHLATEFPAVFAFLWAPGIDASNWRAEQAIRPAVVARKIASSDSDISDNVSDRARCISRSSSWLDRFLPASAERSSLSVRRRWR